MLPSATCDSHVLEVHVLAFRRWLSLGASAPGPLGHVGEAVWGLLAPWNQLFVKTQALWASPLDPDSTCPGMGPGTLPSSRVERGFVCEGCLHPVPQIKLSRAVVHIVFTRSAAERLCCVCFRPAANGAFGACVRSGTCCQCPRRAAWERVPVSLRRSCGLSSPEAAPCTPRPPRAASFSNARDGLLLLSLLGH